MKYSLFILLLFVPELIKAQIDTLFLKNSGQVASFEEADCYRLPYIHEGNKYKVVNYYKDGRLMSEGYSLTFDSLIWDGPYLSYYSNGNKDETGQYANGHKIGNWKKYRNGGKLWTLISYNLLSDTVEILRSFYESGKAKRIEYRIKDKDTKGVCFDENGKEIKFTPFEKIPQFKDGINRFLATQIRYPDEALEGNWQGKVITQFIVNEDGSIDSISILKPLVHPSLMKEAIRVIRLTDGKWEPKIQDDKPVKTYHIVPVIFRLD